jgi:hypothetical protein
MFTILADAMFAATLADRNPSRRDQRSDWDDRFVSDKRRRETQSLYRFNPYRDFM